MDSIFKHSHRNKFLPAFHVIRKFYWAGFFGNWSFATGILIFHYRELGFSFFQIFLLAAIYEGLNFLLEIPTGILADLWGYRKTVVLGCSISAASFFVIFLKPDVYGSYVIWAVLSAVCTTLNSGTYDAFIYETVLREPKISFRKVLGSIRFITFITQAVCIILGGVFSESIGFNLALFLSGIGGLSQTIILFSIPDIEKRNNGEEIYIEAELRNKISAVLQSAKNEITGSKSFQGIFLIGLFIFTIMEYAITIFQPYLNTIGFHSYTIIAVFSAGSMLLMAIGAKAIDLFPVESIFNKKGLSVLFTISCILLCFLFSKGSGLIAFGFLFLFFGAVEVLYMAHINKIIPSNIRATLLSFQNQIFSLVYAIIALFLGWMLEMFQTSVVSAMLGGLFVLMFLGAQSLITKKSVK